ncbi:ChlI component of cobalt chelatase [Cutibacterium acnes JCM 18909]|nr:ChlI component of cobalt chelatase [Cutibacterium acnes JCM 18909]
MAASKGAVLSLLLDAYIKCDRVCLISFRRDRAEVLVPVTSSVEVAQHGLAELPVGGRTRCRPD